MVPGNLLEILSILQGLRIYLLFLLLFKCKRFALPLMCMFVVYGGLKEIFASTKAGQPGGNKWQGKGFDDITSNFIILGFLSSML